MPVNVEFRDVIEGSSNLPHTSGVNELLLTKADSMWEARLSETIDYYDANAESYARRFQFVDLSEHRRQFLQSFREPTGLVLDAGCGPGRDLGFFERDGFRAIGLDKSAELLRIARKAGYPVINGDLRDLPFSSSAFAGLWACASLVHLPNTEVVRALTEFRRVLRPRGSIFLSVRHGCGVEERLDPSGHNRWFYLYSASGIQQLLLESGFVDIDVKVEPGAVNGTWINAHARSAGPADTRGFSANNACVL